MPSNADYERLRAHLVAAHNLAAGLPYPDTSGLRLSISQVIEDLEFREACLDTGGQSEAARLAGSANEAWQATFAPTADSVARYWFDTEFMEDGERIELLSIGIVSDDGREFYAVSADADRSHANDWVVEKVLPHLGGPLMSRPLIAAQLVEFVKAGKGKPEFWAYYGDYDWVVLCQVYGRMIDLPEGWPMFALDVKQLAVSVGNPRLPEQTSTEHNALDDARWTRHAWRFLVSLNGGSGTQ